MYLLVILEPERSDTLTPDMNRSIYFDKFFEHIEKISSLNAADKKLCYNYFELVLFPKNTMIEEAGKIHRFQNFVLSGYVRKFFSDNNGDQITVDINVEPCFFSSYVPMMEKRISQENIEAITDCVLLRIKRENIDILFENSKTIHQYTILLFQNIIEQRTQKALDLANLSAKERYLKFIEQHPNLIQNIPLQYIASYLGITQQSLSRIRNEIFK